MIADAHESELGGERYRNGAPREDLPRQLKAVGDKEKATREKEPAPLKKKPIDRP